MRRTEEVEACGRGDGRRWDTGVRCAVRRVTRCAVHESY
jgi:hypothetical protein